MSQDTPIVAPFRGVRYDSQAADLSRVVAPPYDVISPSLQETLHQRHPYNFVRLILGKEEATDSDKNNRYTRAAATLQDWMQKGVLVRDDEPSYYLYEQHFGQGDHRAVRRGFMALRRIENFGHGKIHPHEKTLAAPKADRLLLIKSCRANLSPIFALYSDPSKELEKLLDSHFQKTPNLDFQDDDGVRHRVWKVTDKALFDKANALMSSKSLFIADGHHRYETAMEYRDWMKNGHSVSPNSSFNYVLMFFSEMSDPGLLIFPTHRVLQNRPDFNTPDFLEKMRPWFEIQVFPQEKKSDFFRALENDSKKGRLTIGMTFKKTNAFYLTTLSDKKAAELPALASLPSAARRVDTVVLHRFLFQEVLNLSESDQKNPNFVRFEKDAGRAFNAVQENNVQAVFFMGFPSMTILKDVVEQGVVLPPKTTFFYPKLLSGLVVRQIDPNEVVTL